MPLFAVSACSPEESEGGDGSAQLLGPDHPDTLNARLNLTTFRGQAGDAAAAAAELEALLPDVLRVHGPDHPRTRTVREYLDHWRQALMDSSGEKS